MTVSFEGIIERYRSFLPVDESTPIVSLNEGFTPLIRSVFFSEKYNADIYFKFEGLNPTGSFKDRGMTMAISKAKEAGAKAVMCASTGNTSASAAAYARRGKMRCIVIIPEGKIALGKLAQAMMHGAEVLAIEGNFDDALDVVKYMTSNFDIALVNSINPYRIEGQKTAAFEICDWLGDAPDHVFIPVGNAGNITSYWKGFREYRQKGFSKKLPSMIGFQAEGAAPIVRKHIIEKPETIATAIRIGNPARWKEAENAASESGGFIDMVTDSRILDAYKALALNEGIFCEPASAACVAGLVRTAEKNMDFISKKQIVCILTGHGLKDPDTAISSSDEIIRVKKDYNQIKEILGL
ncbi:MAG TPA: threonine synthase [Actinobacteria bacterium]|jgi:threonine synthase|nr:threonine synthase [Actinomycetota bacterium]